jgi:hypothetical protein
MSAIPLRTDLAGRLTTVQNSYVLGMAALSMFAAPAALATLSGSQAAFGGFTVPLDQVRVLMSNQATRDESGKAFLLMLMCSLIKDSFELTQHHAKRAGILATALVPLLPDHSELHIAQLSRRDQRERLLASAPNVAQLNHYSRDEQPGIADLIF